MCDVLSYAYDYCIKINKGHVHTRNIKHFGSVFEISQKKDTEEDKTEEKKLQLK